MLAGPTRTDSPPVRLWTEPWVDDRFGDPRSVDVVEVLQREGGIAPAAMLAAHTSRRRLQAAVRDELIIRVRRGWYALPERDARAAAASVDGVLGLLSAARHWGWKVKAEPEHPQVLVPRGRKVAARRRRGIDLRWALLDGDHDGVATTPVRTVIDCARFLPFDEALSVADSALRSGMVSRTELLLAAQKSPRVGRSRAIEVCELADERADNPFESVLRAIVMRVDAHFEPQQWIAHIGRADLVDKEHRIVIEADSYGFHSTREALKRDIERYNDFVTEGWTVLRFSWEHVMFHPEYVIACVQAVIRTQGLSVRDAQLHPAA